MAIAGDIIIKLAADFAEFAEGLTKSTKMLGDLGKEVEKTNASIQSAIGWLKGLAGTAAVTFVLGKITAYTDAIDSQALAIAKLQQQYKLSAIEVQALQGQVEKTGKSFGELVEHASKNPAWLTSIVTNAQAAGTALDEGVIRQISDMDAKATEATKQINAMFAPFYANTKATALENIANTLDGIITRMDEAAAHPTFWGRVGSFFQPGVFDPDTGQAREANATERQANNMAAAEARLKKLLAEQQANIGRNISQGYRNALAEDIRIAEEAINRVRNRALNRAARTRAGIEGNTETNVPFVPDLPKDDKGKGGGGAAKGGKTDVETIDALILRYQKMQQAATEASAAVRGDIETDIQDLGLVIEAKQAAAEAVAKIVARGIDVPKGKIDELERTIFLSKQAQAEQQRGLQYAAQADATQKRLSGTTAGLDDAVQNLTRQFLSGRLGVEAYDRALAEVAEQQEHVRLQARRMDDDIGSLAAGFQDAALSYARSNDLFSQGGQIFGAVTNAMGEGLDALSGKSAKTFDQIAGDFARMLTKMAIQAALSPVFKLISKGLESLLTSATVNFSSKTLDTASSNTVWQSMNLPGKASGGDVVAGSPYWVGEYGPERFVPAASGRIEPSGGGDVFVNIANYTNSKVSAQKSKGPGGQLQVNVLVEAVEGMMASRLSRGQGALGRTMEGNYGLQRVGR